MRDDPEAPKSRFRVSASYLVLIAALVLAAGALLLLPGHDAPTPSPTATISPAPSAADEHEVSAPQGLLSFRLVSGSVVVSLTGADGQTAVLGSGTVSTVMAPTGVEGVSGATGYVMVCPGAHGALDQRYIFGASDLGSALGYAGPAAVGGAASDGPFLFALNPGTIASTAHMDIGTNVTGPDSPGVVDDWSGDPFGLASTQGTLQPSGCRVNG